MKHLLSTILRVVALLAVIMPFAAFGQVIPPSAAPQSEVVTEWLRRSAVPLKSYTAGSGFDDLQPLKEVLRDVRVLGLGEATHGTREFFQVKHRLVEFLARELGFTVFALEVQYMRCLPINEYVLFDQGAFQAVDSAAGDDSIEPLEFTLGPAPAGSGGWQLASAGIGDFVINLRAAPNEPGITNWLGSPQRFRFAGADFSRKWPEQRYTAPLILREQFDGLLFVAKTTRARSLP